MRPRPWLRALLFGAASCLCLCTLSGPVAAADATAPTPTPEAVEKAQALFKKGTELFDSGRYALALQQFRASYASVASPNSRLYIARCLVELGDLPEAYLEFERVAEEAAARAKTEPRYAMTEQTAHLERDELARVLGLVNVTVVHPELATSLTIDGKEVPRARWGKPFPVKPGTVQVVLRTRTSSGVHDVELVAGEAKTLALDAETNAPVGAGLPGEGADALAPEAPGKRAYLRPYAYAAGGVGVAGLAMFTVAGLMANSTYSDLAESCRGPCPPHRRDDIDAGKAQKTVANVGLAIGALGLVAGSTLFLLSLSGGGAGETPGATTSHQLVVGPGFTGLRTTF